MITQPNIVNSRVIYDSAEKAIVQFLAYYTAACTAANTVVVNPKALKYANTARYCGVIVEKIDYHSSMSGTVSVEWEGSTNTSLFMAGLGSGTMYLGASNEATNPTGNIKATIINAGANDSFSMMITVLKAEGFANGSSWFGTGDV